jgi:hypothetical protein
MLAESAGMRCSQIVKTDNHGFVIRKEIATAYAFRIASNSSYVTSC